MRGEGTRHEERGVKGEVCGVKGKVRGLRLCMYVHINYYKEANILTT